MTKRIIALLLALILTVGLLPTVALAADGTEPVSVTKSESKDNLKLVKKVTEDGNNYKVSLEAWATGEVTSSSTPVPMDIILLLDQSSSMGNKFTPKSETVYNKLNKNNRKIYNDYSDKLYFYNGSEYVKVTVKRDMLIGPDKYTYTWAGGNYVSYGSSTHPDPTFYYQTTNSSSKTKKEALKDAVTNFITKVNNEATTKNVEHRVAIVGFASTKERYGKEYKNTELISTKNEVNYANASADNYKDALVDAKTEKNKLNTAIKRLDANGDTYPEYGFDMANKIFAQHPIQAGDNRQRVVIMFTDGYPAPAGTNEFNVGMANNAINNAKRCKDNNAKVYTIGIFDGADPSALIENYSQNGWLNEAVAANRYMHFSSSNYPSAMALNNGGIKGEGNFYFAASNADALNDIFDAISEEISTDTTELDGSATIIDNIPGNFAIPAKAQGITLTVANYKADGSFEAATTAPAGVTAKHENDTVTVTGFDFSDNWCGVDQDGKAHGQKLIIEFTIKHNNYGGTQPTNNGAGIADKDGLEIIKVSDPKVLVKISAPADIFAQEIEKIYDGTGFDILDKVAEKAISLADGKKNKFVDIEVKVTVENTDYTYTIKAGQTTGTWSSSTRPTTSPNVKDENKDGVTEAYEYPVTITFKDAAKGSTASNSTETKAKFKINYAEVTVKADNKTKKTTEADPDFTATVSGMVNGENASEKLKYEITRADPTNNSAGSYTITPAGGQYQNNYKVTYETGTLTITKDETTEITVTITGTQETKVYNGQTQTVTGFTYTVEGEGAGHNDVTVTLKTGNEAKASGKDVLVGTDGKYDATLTYPMHLTADCFDVSSTKYSNVTIEEVKDGWLKITPIAITLKSGDDSKTYDGVALTKNEVTVTSGSFVTGEGLDYSVTGSQTEVGSSKNAYTYTAKNGTTLTNYAITEAKGTLTVTLPDPSIPTVTVDCINPDVSHNDKTGIALTAATQYELGDLQKVTNESAYTRTITLTGAGKEYCIGEYNKDIAGHTEAAGGTTTITLKYSKEGDTWAWRATPTNFLVKVQCNTPTVTVTYTWTGLTGVLFDEDQHKAPTPPTEATVTKGSTHDVDTMYYNGYSVTDVEGNVYKFSGWDQKGTITVQENTTISGTWTKSTGTFDLTNKIFKSFTKEDNSNDIPTANQLTYNFQVKVTRQDNSSDVRYGSVTLGGNETAATAFNFAPNHTLTFDKAGIYTYSVEENSGYVSPNGAVKGNIINDARKYQLTIKVDGNLDVEAYSFIEMPAGDTPTEVVPTGESTITFKNKYLDDPKADDVYLDLSNYVTKTFESRQGKSATETFKARVEIWVKNPEIIVTAAEENAIAVYDSDSVNGTVVYDGIGTVTLSTGEKASFTFATNPKLNRKYAYAIRVTEVTGNNTDVEYDKTEYESRFGFFYDTKEIQWLEGTSNFSFTNTYTGIDDYYPIIIPTIINKDTGMLNKTDHFAYVIGYPDGTVHPNGQITRAEVATIFFRLLRDEVRDGAFTTSNTYSDVVYGKWYNNPISTMSALGIITGYPDGTFKPNKPITRAEFAAIAARFDETQSGKSATFSDVIGHWAAKEIGIAYYNDWIKGYPDGTFKPDQNITRAEAMTLINRVLERKPESPADLLTNMNKWTDNMDTSKWYYLDVQEATNSHAYTRKTFNYELWRQMLPDPDWSRYER